MGKLNEMFGNNGVVKIAALCFKAVTDAHITHLLQPDKTIARHLAFEKFYDGDIVDIVDGLVETYMGLYDIKEISVDSCSKINDPISYFTKLYNDIDSTRKDIKESFIQNQIDTIQEEITHTLYRLKNIIT